MFAPPLSEVKRRYQQSDLLRWKPRLHPARGRASAGRLSFFYEAANSLSRLCLGEGDRGAVCGGRLESESAGSRFSEFGRRQHHSSDPGSIHP